MAVAGMYRRSLPSPPAVDFSSREGKKLFIEALHKGNMEGFFNLISHFQTQSEPAYCGLASLAMVLNALAIDPCRIWKGPWRWFDETMLDCCEPLENVKVKGISFGKVICLAHCAGANVKALRTNQSSIDEFRKHVIACSTSDGCHMISSYNRSVFKQTGPYHFSPIGGYHAESDMVLILDVARFKYPSHWVPLPLLWEAMDSVVGTTELRRGYILVSRPQRAPALLYTLSCKHQSWVSTAKYLMDDVPVLLSSDNMKDITDVISTIITSLPSDFAEFIKSVVELHREEEGSQAPSHKEKGRLDLKEEVLKLLQETSLYKHLTETLSSQNIFIKTNKESSCHRDSFPNIEAGNARCQEGARKPRLCCGETSVRHNNSIGNQGADTLIPLSQRERSSLTFNSSCMQQAASSEIFLTALLLALPPQTWSAIKDEQVLKEISDLVSTNSFSPLLQDEISHVRNQFLVLERCKDDTAEYDQIP